MRSEPALPGVHPEARPNLTLREHMAADHGRMARTLEHVHQLVRDGDFERAGHQFAELRIAHDRHVQLEEHVLFPLFLELTGLNGPTVVMQREHVAIDAALDTMAIALDHRDATAFLLGWAALSEVLPAHEAKEERVIYPTVDRLLRPSKREALLRRLGAE